MSTNFERTYHTMKSFVGFDDHALLEEFKEVMEKVKIKNELNIEAQIKVADHTKQSIRIGSYLQGEDYEVLTGVREFEGEEFTTEDEYTAHLKERAPEEEEGWEEEQPSFEDLDFKADDVMWNTAWNFNYYEEVNKELAERLGLIVLRFYDGEHEGEEYVTISSIGIDNTPVLIAYKVLEFGSVNMEDIHHFTSKSGREFFRYMVKSEIYQEVLEKLNIQAIVNELDGETEK